MQLRTKIEPLHGGSIIHLAGRLLTNETIELSAVYRTVQKPVYVDLHDLEIADANGIELLKDWRMEGVRLIGVPAQVARLLHQQ